MKIIETQNQQGESQHSQNVKIGTPNKRRWGKWIALKLLKFFAKDDLNLSENDKIPATFWLDIILNIVIIVALVLFIRAFVISPFQVYGPSMCDTLNNIDNTCIKGYGEYIIINKFGYQNLLGWQIGSPQRGDIIVFHPPKKDNEFFIKRIIGLPGETVKLQNGEVYIYNSDYPEGFKLQEGYLNAQNAGNTHPYTSSLTTFEVPSGHYFVMGDNRLFSSDSRHCFKEGAGDNQCGVDPLAPFLPRENIEGKAWIVLWPLQKIAILAGAKY